MTTKRPNSRLPGLQPLSPAAEAGIPLNLIESLRHREALLMVGSGMSIPVGFPSWGTLITKLYQQIESTVWSRDDKTHQKIC